MNLPLSSGGRQPTFLFPADQETEVRLSVRMKFTDLLEILKRSPDPDWIPCRVDAHLHVKTPLGETVVPMGKETLVVLPERYRPSFYLNRLRGTLQGLR